MPLWSDAVSRGDAESGVETRDAIRVVVRNQPAPESFGFDVIRQEPVLVWPGIGALRVTAGRLVELFPDAPSDVEALALAAAGPGLAMALHQRGLCMVHGSCVAQKAFAVCLAGPPGSGKSTLALALCRQGGRLVSDGMTAIDLASSPPLALRGPAQAKLWPDALRELGERADLPRVAAAHDKRVLTLESFAAERRVPLTSIVVLRASGPVALEAPSAASGAVLLASNLFLGDFAGDASAPELLRQAAELARRVSVNILSRGASLDDLARAVELVDSVP